MKRNGLFSKKNLGRAMALAVAVTLMVVPVTVSVSGENETGIIESTATVAGSTGAGADGSNTIPESSEKPSDDVNPVESDEQISDTEVTTESSSDNEEGAGGETVMEETQEPSEAPEAKEIIPKSFEEFKSQISLEKLSMYPLIEKLLAARNIKAEDKSDKTAGKSESDSTKSTFKNPFSVNDKATKRALLGADEGGLKLNTDAPVIPVGNNGYPYAYDYEEDGSIDEYSIVLALDLPSDTPADTAFQWQYAQSADGPFEDIPDDDGNGYANKSTIRVGSDGLNRVWLRCVINDNSANVTKPVMLLTPQNDQAAGYRCESIGNGLFVSNGKMAYKVHGDKQFNIIGEYEKEGQKYWVNTSYNYYWSVRSSQEASPASSASLYGDGIERMMMSFDEENAAVVRVKCLLKDGYHSMVVGTDTMLGAYSTEPYSDSASLKAIIDKDTLKQVQIVAAHSLPEATDDTCAFVFKPNTKPTYFWIGGYGDGGSYEGAAYSYHEYLDINNIDLDTLREEYINAYKEQYYEYEYQYYLRCGYSEEESAARATQVVEDAMPEIVEEVEEEIEYICEYPNPEYNIYSNFRGNKVATEVVGMDSAMSMSWTNIQDGVVEFQYNVGKVSETGAVTQSIPTSYDITVPKIDPNYYYALYDEDGNRMTDWTNTPNAGADPEHLTDIKFEGLDPDTKYVVKNIPKSAYEADPENPDLSGAEDEDVRTNIDPIEPTPEEKEAGAVAAVVSATSRTILLEHPRKDREYALEEAYYGDLYTVTPYRPVGADDSVLFEETEDYGDVYPLVPGTQYYIVAKSDNNPTSDKIPVRTLNAAIFVDSQESTYMDEDDLRRYFQTYGEYGPQTYAEIYDIKAGAKINPPKSPDKNGKIFEAWLYEDENGNFVPWNFEEDTVDGNMVFYAKWSEEDHTHVWQYVYSPASPNTLKAYCNNETGIKCTHFGTSLTNCEDPLKAVIKAYNASYTGEAYDLYNIDVFDSIAGADSSNHFGDALTFFVDEECTVKTTSENSGAATEGGAPVNAGSYWLQADYIGNGGNTYKLTTDFKIVPRLLNNADMLIDGPDFAYTGSEIKPVVTFAAGLSLTEGTDYDYSPEAVKGATDIGTYKIAVEFKGNYKGTALKTWRITDANPPTGSIEVEGFDDPFVDFDASSEISRFFNSGRKVKITAHDEETEDSEINVYYYVASTSYSEDEVATFPDSKWTKIANGGSFDASTDRQYKIYVKIVDASGREVYLSTTGFVVDRVAPEVSGITNGAKYCNKTSYYVSDKVSGIMCILVNGTDVYRNNKTDYTLSGDYENPDEKYTIEVTDKAGNTTTVSDISLFVESEHKWKDGEIIKESTCSERGLRKQKCSICGAERNRELSLKSHVYDFDSDKNWSVVWTYDANTETYNCVAYLYCKNGCGNCKKYDEAHCVITKSEGADGEIVYTATVTDENDPTHTKTFTVSAKPTATKEEIGENTLSTSVVEAPGAPSVSVSGFTPENSKANLSAYERSSLQNTGDNIKTTIDEYMVVKNANPIVGADERVLAEDSLLDYLGSEELPEVSYVDMSLFKNFKEEKIDDDGTVLETVSEKTEQIYDYQRDMTIGINVNELGFKPPKAGTTRIYYVSRVHDYDDGTAAEIIFAGAATGGKINITTNLFCPFAITYKDVPGGKPSGGGGSGSDDEIPVSSNISPAQIQQIVAAQPAAVAYASPKTGDNSHVVLWSIIGAIFAALFVMMTLFLKDTGLFKIIKRLF